MGNPIKRLRESPSYIFGRFSIVRSTYSSLKRLQQTISPGARKLQIGEKYGPGLATLPVSCGGLVQSSCSTDTHVRRLMRDAVSTEISLTTEACESLQREGLSAGLNGGRHRGIQYAEVERSETLRASEAVLTVPRTSQLETIRVIASDRKLVEVAATYLGYTPTLVATWMFWNIRNGMSRAEREANYQTVNFHYDVHGLNFVYVNFYLTAVDARSGAHVLIEASHHDKSLRRLFGTARLADDDALRDYGAARVRTITGPAGTGFFEDASCYHKALAPLDRDRLMLQLRYL